MLLDIRERAARNQRQTPFQPIGESLQPFAQGWGHMDAIGRAGQFHQSSVEIEEERQWRIAR